VGAHLTPRGTAGWAGAFAAEQAHRLARRLEIHHTPRNGSWLNVAEVELSVLSRQCLNRRIGSPEELKQELAAWQQERNADRAAVRLRFTTGDACVRLRDLDPQF